MKLDEVYANLMELMASGLGEVKRKRSQEWFSNQLVELKRSVRKVESACLQSGLREGRNEKRKVYLEKQGFYMLKLCVGRRESMNSV